MARSEEPSTGRTSGTLLAIETSGDVCSFAVLCEGQLQAERTFRHEMHLSENLPATLEGLCNDAYVTLEEIGAFAVGIGPGSFTGTRIGVMTAKVFAEVYGRPLFGVNALEALAAEYLGLHETVVLVVLPCRAGVVYAALYDVSDVLPRALVEPAAFSVNELVKQIEGFKEKPWILCGPAAADIFCQWKGWFSERLSLAAFCLESPRASTIGRLAWRRKEQGEVGESPVTLVPAYIAPPPISTPKRR
ncbi:tRNA (adenosine(37)-N6)-threonylcarbamoyltransferase complex dimerization subunit type 1 TsaB [Chthonomonas calidirosea]|uniref:tRNA (adenosine(37)-N6)-threonylcarbamoyltransferase complex dimerization subunit type 1 TsaB n=1 Tax=Chthonomonas calidirosea TaxID=454171 RepID=UPI0006ECACFF|nr:tRNA (adenosine(37)-N6)-threonylcarbamoyltransferase complex dimerization subunit type 1 TsaB [Chthonomonas calidirosea]CEK12458.1 tRNA threonylcarbamoyl adenosine modification protein YeaZ [Chthonomonas calidirosea]